MHSSTAKNLRPLDHLVLPTADLDVARARLTALGFTVAPRGAHPFGTANACVYFADGTFLEPLALADPAVAGRAAAAGNVFVARDRAYRASRGEEGFSALVMATGDAGADHARFARAGISAGEMLAFTRPFVDGEGRQDTASFLLAFAAETSSPDCYFFTCERVNAPKVDRSALEKHANGAAGIARIFLSAADPARHAEFLRQVTGGTLSEGSDGIYLGTAGATVSVLTPEALRVATGIEAGRDDALRLCAVSFRLSDPAIAENLLARNNIPCKRREGRIVVAPASGQGAAFAFEVSP